MKISTVDSIGSISESTWSSVAPIGDPFLDYRFLSALENTACLGAELGWFPRHVLVRDESGHIIAAMPCYIKTNSYGELVFDWAWADAYQRNGRRYYPKLVSAIPYTPATGPRFLIAKSRSASAIIPLLSRYLMEYAQQHQLSSVHILFPDRDQLDVCDESYMSRLGCQFHWKNRGYGTFEDFLGDMKSRHRKNVKRERSKVLSTGVEIVRKHGSELSAEDWQQIYPFYRDTFLEKGGIPTLSEAFFVEVSRSMGEQLLVVLAVFQGELVAASIFFQSRTTLYGRHWGCKKQFDSLHFELCYYQGIEYAIEHRLERFEPGAQGEYKIARGFLPTATWSTHWIKDDDFRPAIKDFLNREGAYMESYIRDMSELSPFRDDVVF